jgi:hypothetical protein
MSNLDWLKKFIKADLSQDEIDQDKTEPKKPVKKGLK